MANNVETSVVIRNLDKKGNEVLDSIFRSLDDYPSRSSKSSYGFSSGWNLFDYFKRGFDEELHENHYAYAINTMGAKWVILNNVEKESDNYESFELLSAWSVPVDALQHIFEKIHAVCPRATFGVKFEDEFHNFLGYMTWRDGDFEDEEWIHSDTLVQELIQIDKDLEDELDGEGWFNVEDEDTQDAVWDAEYQLLERIDNAMIWQLDQYDKEWLEESSNG